MLGVISLRFATRFLVLSRTPHCRPTHRHAFFRTFSTTPRRLTAEVSDDFINSIKDTPLYKKLEDSPNALKALSDLYALTKEMGLDINAKDPPSPYQMFKLVTNRRFTRAVKRVTTELSAAGLKMNSENALQELLALTQQVKPPQARKDDS
ncbi:hypothetical protein BJV74DRAFT_63657 [Russula compacta]|nr:hypothetical protein BJV74DRAFT_63657 [Russula compacta]